MITLWRSGQKEGRVAGHDERRVVVLVLHHDGDGLLGREPGRALNSDGPNESVRG
jgi:hypothetical protein